MTEEWKQVPGWPYEAHHLGLVRSQKTGRILTPQLNYKGYFRIALSDGARKRSTFVHVLVLEAFVGLRPEGTTTSHIDGRRTNNNLSNLRWESLSDNCARKLEHGTLKRGSETSHSKLTEEQVREIRDAAVFKAHGARRRLSNCRELRERYGVTKRTIADIVYGNTWKCAGPGHARAI